MYLSIQESNPFNSLNQKSSLTTPHYPTLAPNIQFNYCANCLYFSPIKFIRHQILILPSQPHCDGGCCTRQIYSLVFLSQESHHHRHTPPLSSSLCRREAPAAWRSHAPTTDRFSSPFGLMPAGPSIDRLSRSP